MTEIGESVGVPVIGAAEEREEREATITARWSKRWVTPDHNSNWPPKSPPTDDVPEEAKVRMLVATSEVPDGTTARITVHHCHTKALVKDGTIDGLEVRGNRVIDPRTGAAPEFVFQAKHDLWDPWDKPFYYFKVTVQYRGLQTETPRNYEKERQRVLRISYWSVCASDAIADTPAGGSLTTRSEMQEIAGIIAGGQHHSVDRRVFQRKTIPTSRWGSVLRNTYAYHHASHGDIQDRSTGKSLFQTRCPVCGSVYTTVVGSLCPKDQARLVSPNPPTVPLGNWRSVIVLGDTSFGDDEVNDVGNVPSVPRYLAYMNTCVAGWEPSLGKAFVNRGTQNYIAFRMYIPDGAAREMARKFHRKWIRTYKGDPARIPQIFWDVGAAYYDSMRPVLFGKGGGEIHRTQMLNVLEEAFAGMKAKISSFFR